MTKASVRFQDAENRLHTLHVDLLRDRERVVHFNPEIPHGAFDLRMPEQQLDCAEIACLAINQRCLGSAQGMRPLVGRIKPDHRNPLRNQTSILTCRQ